MTEDINDSLAKAQYLFKKDYRFKSLKHNFITEVIFIASCLVSIFIVSLFIDISNVRGDGMTPTFKKGTYVVVNRLSYFSGTPERGDVVAVNGRITRIVGIPGDTISFNGGHVYINGALAKETYIDNDIYSSPIGNRTDFTIGSGEYFALCDNRNCTDDSRTGYTLKLSDIQGEIVFAI